MNFSTAFEGTRASCKAHVDPASAWRNHVGLAWSNEGLIGFWHLRLGERVGYLEKVLGESAEKHMQAAMITVHVQKTRGGRIQEHIQGNYHVACQYVSSSNFG